MATIFSAKEANIIYEKINTSLRDFLMSTLSW